jgi:hypothetical protein
MTSQAADGPTQVLSQSSYRDKPISGEWGGQSFPGLDLDEGFHEDWEEDVGEDLVEGISYRPGDAGYVDLLSSLDSPDPHDEGEQPEFDGNNAVRESDSERPGQVRDHEQEHLDSTEHTYQQQKTDTKQLEDGNSPSQNHRQDGADEQQVDLELQDSEPVEVDFSPSQRQKPLSQFPESQRFKTPGTAGRKRRYNGDFTDSPKLPRNPLPPFDGGKNVLAMGLSQAFEATQANTSPFTVGVDNPLLPSDRPSPNIDVQYRPVTPGLAFERPHTSAASSSPMRLLSTAKPFKRTKSEPLEHYTSTKESQDRREKARQRDLQQEESSDEDEFQIDFAENSIDAAERRQRERNQKWQAKLSSSSPLRSAQAGSPTRHPQGRRLGNSSPGQPRRRGRGHPLPWRNPSPPLRYPQATESEDETDKEDQTDIPVGDSSQSSQLPTEDDKENFSGPLLRIPETAARLQHILNGSALPLQESPLISHGQRYRTDRQTLLINGSSPFVVANSQPERAPRPTTSDQAPASSAVDAIVFVPQSPESTPRPTAPSNLKVGKALGSGDAFEEDEVLPGMQVENTSPAASRPPTQIPNSTIPETSSNEESIHGDSCEISKPQFGENHSRGEFDSAQTHLQPSTTSSKHSTTAHGTTHPGIAVPSAKKRKLMADIAADPSPLKSQISFDASQALLLEEPFLGSAQSPTAGRASRKISNRNEASVSASKPCETEGNTPAHPGEEASPHTSTPQESNHIADPEASPEALVGQETAEHSSLQVQPDLSPMSRPRRERKLTAKAASIQENVATKSVPVASSRTSLFDLPDSSPRKIMLGGVSATRLKRKAEAIEDPAGETTARPSKRRASTKQKTLDQNPESAGNTGQGESLRAPEEEPRPATDEPTVTASPTEILDSGDNSISAPNMVLAVFNGNSRSYHPALCLGRCDTNSSRFRVQWPGYAPDVVDEHGVRSLDLRIGDQVKVELKGFPKVTHIIRGFKDRTERRGTENVEMITDIRGYQTVILAPKQRKSLPANVTVDAVKQVPVSAIYLDSNMWHQMKERTFDYRPVVLSGTPTPAELPSTPSTPRSRSRRKRVADSPPPSSAASSARGLFSSMAFAVSYGDNDRRKHLLRLIHDNGGVVLKDDFLSLFEQDSFQLKDKYSGLNFAALITDRHTRREKFLQALALGLPCLSGMWIETSVENEKLEDSSLYLLPAGECTELEGAIKSRNLPLPANLDDLTLEETTASRKQVLAGSRVVFHAGKGKAAEERAKYLPLIRALGPSHIEMVSDLTSISALVQAAAGSPECIDYVVVHDKDQEAARDMLVPAVSTGAAKSRSKGRPKRQQSISKMEDEGAGLSVKIMCSEDIVQTLILGRLWIAS